MLDSLLSAVMLTMSQAGEFDAAAHIAGIDAGSGELIDAGVFSLDQSGGDQRHSAANHVHGDYVETFFCVRRQLAEIGAEQIGKWSGGVDAFIPAAERSVLRAFNDGWPNNGDGQILSVARKN